MPHAILFDEPGPPDVLHWREVESLRPASHEVIIGVDAAGVNNADLLQRQGAYPVPPDAPRILGLECAGRITALGDDVSDWAVGDRVCALLDGGGYADEVAVAASQLLPVPDALSIVEAAALPEAACTVYSNLAMIAGLRSGQTVLVHGASGGIGTFAIQWATAIGAAVIATASTPAKMDAGRRLGASTVINYRTEDFVAATLAATDGRGVDAILDVVGADYLDRNVRCLADDGHLVIIGGTLAPVSLDLGALISKRASVSATMLRPRPLSQKTEVVAGVRRDILPLVESGAFRPVIDTVIPIAEAAAAHELLHGGKTIGNVVLENR
jgi:putative PIG3 family NAD(P)H quinone oxidoreductase